MYEGQIKNNKRVLVAMSGGVDSSVAAALLKDRGYEVAGAHMLCWDGCENNGDKQDAERVAATLGIPFYTFDFRKEYRAAVYEYMVMEYRAGRTPNPDVMCNKAIKFGIFLERALELGFDYIATGHYVRLAQGIRPEGPGSFRLYGASDQSKDQSYFLWTLTQDQLQHSLFPIGDYLKSEVRELAKKFNLPTAAKKDSQGLCFVGKVDFGEFLREALPKNPGPVVDVAGKKLGEHDGTHFYTLGQRHGLNIGGSSEPLYVAHKDLKANTLVMAAGDEDSELYCDELTAGGLNWIGGNPPLSSENIFSRVRYRQPLQRCSIEYSGEKMRVKFDKPQRAVTPGQSAVFYSEEGEMLGGGVIK